MKKLFCICCISFCSLAKASAYPDEVLTKLYDYLRPNISTISWMDINPAATKSTCQFAVRYYPCSPDNQHQLGQLLPIALEKTTPKCTLKNPGKHEQTEGYCTLNNVVLSCH